VDPQAWDAAGVLQRVADPAHHGAGVQGRAGSDGQAGGGGLPDVDGALRAVEGDLAERPRGSELGAAALAVTRDPVGRWTVTSTAPVLPRTRWPAGAVTRTVPSP
jgi:hypothetical protein